MKEANYNPNNLQGKNTKKDYAKSVFSAFYCEGISRRTAATKIGFVDQTYMVTQLVSDWLKQGKAAIIGKVKCERSGRWVEKVTTNPDLFPKSNQLKLF